MQTHEELPSGKKITRRFDEQGHVASESHVYGMLKIGITMEFQAGVKTGEMYFVNRKLASRKRYEKARLEYADMPAVDEQFGDVGGELLKGARAERRQQAKAARESPPDPQAAAKMDSFCQSILTTGRREEAEQWIESRNHTLGEYSHIRSRNLIKKLKRIGSRQVYACNIDADEGYENTGHLIIELPDDPETRKTLFREIGRLASSQGFQRDVDHGQRYAYIKLD